MKSVTVEITGTSPLMQHRWSEESEVDEPTRRVLIRRGTPREEAEKVVYRHPDGWCYLPGAAIARALREAGGAHKQKGSRKSTKYVVPAAVIVSEDAIQLHNGEPLTDYEVDSRPVVIPSTKGRIMRHRPRFDEWQATFTLEIDTDILPTDFIHQLLAEAGRSQGLLEYRPEKGGPFGRFRVTNWDEKDLIDA